MKITLDLYLLVGALIDAPPHAVLTVGRHLGRVLTTQWKSMVRYYVLIGNLLSSMERGNKLICKTWYFVLIFWGNLLYGHFWVSSSVMLDFGWQLVFHFSTIHWSLWGNSLRMPYWTHLSYRCSPDSPCGGSRGTSAGASPSSTPASIYSQTYPADLAEHTLYTHVHVGRQIFLCRGNKLKTIDHRPFGCQ